MPKTILPEEAKEIIERARGRAAPATVVSEQSAQLTKSPKRPNTIRLTEKELASMDSSELINLWTKAPRESDLIRITGSEITRRMSREAPTRPSYGAYAGEGFLRGLSGIRQTLATGKDEEALRKREDARRARFDRAAETAGSQPLGTALKIGGEIGAYAPMAIGAEGLPIVGAASKIPLIGRAIAGAAYRAPKTVGAAIKGIGTGAIAGSQLYTPEGGSNFANALLGATFGIALPPITQGAKRLGAWGINKLGNLASALGSPSVSGAAGRATSGIPPPPGTPPGTPPLVDMDRLSAMAEQQLSRTGKMDESALARAARLQALGFTDDSAPTVGQLSRSPTQFAREQNLRRIEGVGDIPGGLGDRFTRQAGRLREITDEMAASTGAQRAGVGQTEMVGQRAFDKLDNYFDRMNKLVEAEYNRATRRYGHLSGVKIDNLLRTLENESIDSSKDKATKSTRNLLTARGLLEDGAPTNRELTLEEAYGLRKAISGFSNFDSNRDAKRNLIMALDQDTLPIAGPTGGYTKAIGRARKNFLDQEDKIVKKILKRTLNPKNMVNTLASESSENVARMLSIMERTPVGRQAAADLKGQLVVDMAGIPGDTTILGQTFVKQLNQLGDKKLELLYPGRLAHIRELKQAVMDLNIPPYASPINYSGSTLSAINLLGGGSLPKAGTNVLSKIGQRSEADYALGATGANIVPLSAQAEANAALREAAERMINQNPISRGAYRAGRVVLPPAITQQAIQEINQELPQWQPPLRRNSR